MGTLWEQTIDNRRLMAYTAAAMYGAAAFDGCVEGFIPGDPSVAVAPVLIVVLMTAGLLVYGRRLPRRLLGLVGPIGVALTACVLSGQPGADDAAVLYALPVLWTTVFFGRRGAVAIVGCVAAGHALALASLPRTSAYPGRWMDVMVSVVAIAIVVVALERRNQILVERLADEARTDPLTGLLNRRGFDERAALALAHGRRNMTPTALVAFDIDHFKAINDACGHEAGDRVLAGIGRLLRGAAREVDVIARRGGEEFAVLLPNCDEAGADTFAERVRAALARSEGAGDLAGPVQVSAGVVAGCAGDDLAELLQRADVALYEAKRTGRNRVVVFDAVTV